ncbi:MAG: hypothetical protein B6U87_01305 [Candidatus Aenigmarchaeota archaeon ex4484_52]|nr:MAG: hypothetical protein B6U87_01305 [Candidatus Aenigmarchaeota archaeon ex4484_52]
MSQKFDDILNTLTKNEKKILIGLKTTLNLEQLINSTKMQKIDVLRSLMWLSNKNIVKLKTESQMAIILDENGLKYQKTALPETRIIDYLVQKKKASTDDLKQKLNLKSDEIQYSIGFLKKNKSIEIEKKQNKLYLILTNQGKTKAKQKSQYDLFLQMKFPLKLKDITNEQNKIIKSLNLRKKIIKNKEIKTIDIELTKFGEKIINCDFEFDNQEDILTSSMLKTGLWREKNFRQYDISSPVPKIQRGRRHPVKEVCNLIKNIFIQMGFKEMIGPWVETAFWCMDSMWIPQDHPARDVQDTFFIGKQGNLPDKKLVQRVREAHENGGETGSTGYGIKWNEKKAKELILRTHSTATTFRMFGLHNINYDCKYFYIANTFRNEAIDATHLPEFLQAEGFIMADDLTLSDLMGFVKEFYSKLGIKKIKFKPTYNPYTEPSMEAHYWDEKNKKWYALINSGIFRPEALYPYGIKKTVIAWGMGVSRMASLLAKKNNLRQLIGAGCDIDWIQNHKAILI